MEGERVGGFFRCCFCVSGSGAEHECEVLHYCRGASEGYLRDRMGGRSAPACVLNFVARFKRLNLCACLLLGEGTACVCLWDLQREHTHSH